MTIPYGSAGPSPDEIEEIDVSTHSNPGRKIPLHSPPLCSYCRRPLGGDPSCPGCGAPNPRTDPQLSRISGYEDLSL